MDPSPFTARWASVTIATTAAVDSVAEPDAHPAARPFKEALVADGIPINSSVVDDLNAEFERLRGPGVRFTQEPLEMGGVATAVR